MTIKEALDKKIKRICLARWDDRAYVELKDPVYGILYDPHGNLAMAHPQDHGTVLLLTRLELKLGDDWEEYNGPAAGEPLLLRRFPWLAER